MADKRRAKDNALVNAAKAIGNAAGKVAVLVGAVPGETPLPIKPLRKGKLLKKDRPHLPRRLKKDAKKRAALSSAKA